MPSNADFNLQILVGEGTVLPEYEHDGEIFVESNLFTPYSYKQNLQQMVSGELEAQKWPVTPFRISVESKPGTPPCYYRISIDGQKVKGLGVGSCEKRIVRGFKDGTAVREFLFSLPRFASDEDDRMDISCRNKVGTIEVECYNAQKRQTRKRLHSKTLDFEQANKKDSINVTKGKYLMATTRAGRVINSRDLYKITDFWDIVSVRSKLSVKYVTAQTLQEMGFSIIPIPFPRNNLTPGAESEVSDGTLCSGSNNITVVLDLTQEKPTCSFIPTVKTEVEEDTDMDYNNSNIDLRKENSSDTSRVSKHKIHPLPSDMLNSTIDLTEDEEIQESENTNTQQEDLNDIESSTDKQSENENKVKQVDKSNSELNDNEKMLVQGENSNNEEAENEKKAKQAKLSENEDKLLQEDLSDSELTKNSNNEETENEKKAEQAKLSENELTENENKLLQEDNSDSELIENSNSEETENERKAKRAKFSENELTENENKLLQEDNSDSELIENSNSEETENERKAKRAKFSENELTENENKLLQEDNSDSELIKNSNSEETENERKAKRAKFSENELDEKENKLLQVEKNSSNNESSENQNIAEQATVSDLNENENATLQEENSADNKDTENENTVLHVETVDDRNEHITQDENAQMEIVNASNENVVQSEGNTQIEPISTTRENVAQSEGNTQVEPVDTTSENVAQSEGNTQVEPVDTSTENVTQAEDNTQTETGSNKQV